MNRDKSVWWVIWGIIVGQALMNNYFGSCIGELRNRVKALESEARDE